MEKFSHPTAKPGPGWPYADGSHPLPGARTRHLGEVVDRFGDFYEFSTLGAEYIADRKSEGTLAKRLTRHTPADLEAALETDLAEWREERQTQHPERF